MPQFVLFLLVTAALMLRPAELIRDLENQPVYETLIVAALVAAFPRLIAQLSPNFISSSPITACVLGLCLAVPMSLLGSSGGSAAVHAGTMYLKIAAFYLLMTASVRTVPHFRTLLWCLTFLILCQAAFGLLGYAGYIDSEAVKAYSQSERDPESGEIRILPRLCGAGIFNDPNDLCVLLAIGVILCLFAVGNRRLGLARWFAIAPLGVIVAAIQLTHSRGGLMAVLAGLAVLATNRLGMRRGLLVLGVVLAPLLLAVGGRITRFDIGDSDDTSQHRMRLWSDSLVLMRSAPAFGIGQGNIEDEIGLVAHNSFVHAFTELGFFGGTCFFGMFAYSVLTLRSVGTRLDPLRHPTLCRFRPYLLAIVVSQGVGLLSLSRVYVQPIYLVFGLCTVYFNLVLAAVPHSVPPITLRRAMMLVLLSALFLLGLHFLTVAMTR